MASRIKQDPTYKEYLANGGGFASYLTDENTFRAHLAVLDVKGVTK